MFLTGITGKLWDFIVIFTVSISIVREVFTSINLMEYSTLSVLFLNTHFVMLPSFSYII